MLDNPLLTTVGALIGVSGSILSYIMCVAMNRGLTNVLFGGIAPTDNSEFKIEGQITKTTVEETADALATAESVIIVVGYGMAVAKAQYAISDITRMLKHKGVNVRFAIHPVAGRMPGQCNVLLAEASVPYDSKSCHTPSPQRPLTDQSRPRNGRNQRRLFRHRRHARHRRKRHREPHRPGTRLLYCRHARTARMEEQAGYCDEARDEFGLCRCAEPDVLYARD
jgi:NAD(P) transhydrogenase beta subunit